MVTVDVVIPTMGRASARRAIASVRAQADVDVRLHIVLDDPTAESVVGPLAVDGELIVTAGGTGGANARNLGLRASSSRWVAYLDDDDWWEPNRLAVQLAHAARARASIHLCGAVFHQPDGRTRAMPRSAPPRTGFADYIVARPDLTYGRSFVQSSCILVDRDNAPDVEWDASMPKHQDWDYALRLAAGDRGVGFVPSRLAHVEQGSAGSVSNLRAWAASRRWYEAHAISLSARGRGDFIAAHVLRSALAAHDRAGIKYALNELRRSRPHASALITGASGAVEGALARRRRKRDGKPQ